MIKKDYATYELDNEEAEVRFEKPYKFFWAKSLSGTLYISMEPDIVPEAEGVMPINEGSSGGTFQDDDKYVFYIYGTGKAVVCGTYENVNPFVKKVEGGDPSGGGKSYKHIQTTKAKTWNVTHNLDVTYPNVLCVDENGATILGGVTYTSTNALKISYSEAVKGTAMIRG